VPDYGWAWLGRQFRPIFKARWIKRGQNEGLVEVTLSTGKTKILEPKHIRRWPVTEEPLWQDQPSSK